MRIGIDARELCGRPTGVGRYLAGLVTTWSAEPEYAAHEIILYAPSTPLIASTLDPARFIVRLLSTQPGFVWEQVHLLRAAAADRLDVFFAPGYTAPLALRVPLVVTIHDLSFAAHPEWFRMREGIRRRAVTRWTARRARAILAVSQFGGNEIMARLGIPSDRVHVVYEAIEHSAPSTSHTPGTASVLFVGSIFNRRHVPDLIRACGHLARSRRDVSLDIVGDNRSYPYQDLPQLIRTQGLEGRARWHAYVTERELRALYQQARAFAFLSDYEGFGLTPLEALAAGVPPVLLDTPVSREICGPAGVYVADCSTAAVAGALERALFDESVRASILDAAPAILGRYSWPRAARETMAVILAAPGR